MPITCSNSHSEKVRSKRNTATFSYDGSATLQCCLLNIKRFLFLRGPQISLVETGIARTIVIIIINHNRINICYCHRVSRDKARTRNRDCRTIKLVKIVTGLIKTLSWQNTIRIRPVAVDTLGVYVCSDRYVLRNIFFHHRSDDVRLTSDWYGFLVYLRPTDNSRVQQVLSMH